MACLSLPISLSLYPNNHGFSDQVVTEKEIRKPFKRAKSVSQQIYSAGLSPAQHNVESDMIDLIQALPADEAVVLTRDTPATSKLNGLLSLFRVSSRHASLHRTQPPGTLAPKRGDSR